MPLLKHYDVKVWGSNIPDFWTNSRPKFEFWGRLDQLSSRFLEFLDFSKKKLEIEKTKPKFVSSVPFLISNFFNSKTAQLVKEIGRRKNIYFR